LYIFPHFDIYIRRVEVIRQPRWNAVAVLLLLGVAILLGYGFPGLLPTGSESEIEFARRFSWHESP